MSIYQQIETRTGATERIIMTITLESVRGAGDRPEPSAGERYKGRTPVREEHGGNSIRRDAGHAICIVGLSRTSLRVLRQEVRCKKKRARWQKLVERRKSCHPRNECMDMP